MEGKRRDRKVARKIYEMSAGDERENAVILS